MNLIISQVDSAYCKADYLPVGTDGCIECKWTWNGAGQGWEYQWNEYPEYYTLL